MTIDLGFAWLTLPSGREVSIVDVPGHERFIKNMLAGVGGVDIALLVVAADEGVMPQTREHLAILDLLDVRAGAVAITKRDLVDSDWLDLVTEEVRDVLKPTSLAGARLLPVSSTTGEGLDELATELDRLLAPERTRRQTGWPRLPVDRVFTMPGFGTVVTGTLIDGELHVGQEVELQPSGHRTRIRGLQAHRARIERAPAGTRVAANLVGLGVEDVDRGEVLTSPGWMKPTRVVDVRLRLVEDAPRAVPHNAQVSFHSGAAEALGRMALLDADRLEPGKLGWAQIHLDRPVALARGDLFIVRLPAANLTIGGGTVVDDHPKRHRRFQSRILADLDLLEHGTPEDHAIQALRIREPAQLHETANRLALTPAEAWATFTPLLEKGLVLSLGEDDPASAARPEDTLLISAQGWERIQQIVAEALRSYHAQHPLRRGMPREELRRHLQLESRLYSRVEATLVREHAIAHDGALVRLAGHSVELSETDAERARRFITELKAAGITVPARAEVMARHGLADDLVQVLIDRGDVEEVTPELLYARETYDVLSEKLLSLLAERGRITVAEVRDTLGTSRKYALALLEHLDDLKVTRRVGDERIALTTGGEARQRGRSPS